MSSEDNKEDAKAADLKQGEEKIPAVDDEKDNPAPPSASDEDDDKQQRSNSSSNQDHDTKDLPPGEDDDPGAGAAATSSTAAATDSVLGEKKDHDSSSTNKGNEIMGEEKENSGDDVVRNIKNEDNIIKESEETPMVSIEDNNNDEKANNISNNTEMDDADKDTTNDDTKNKESDSKIEVDDNMNDKGEEEDGQKNGGENHKVREEKKDENMNNENKNKKEEDGIEEDEKHDDNDNDNASIGTADESRVEDDHDHNNESTTATTTIKQQQQNSRTTNHSGNTTSNSRPRYDMPDYLDRNTINSIKSYLTEFDAREELDEDEVVLLWTKTDRNVEHRARYFTNPLDDIVDEEMMHKDFKKEEEDYLVGHDFLKAMTTSLNAKRRRALDKRTVNWVKKAAGLIRRDYHSPHSAVGLSRGGDDPHHHDSDDGGEGGGGRRGAIAPRRYTRGMAKTTRQKKQEEFQFKDNLGLKSLLHAIEEMEPTYGPYPVPFECARASSRAREAQRDKSPSSRRKQQAAGGGRTKKQSTHHDHLLHHRHQGHQQSTSVAAVLSDDESLAREKERRTFDPVTMRPLVARITEQDSLIGQARNRNFIFGDNRDILVTHIYVNGEHVSEDEEDRMPLSVRKRELKRLRDRQYQKRRRDRKLAARGEKRMVPKTNAITTTTPLRSNISGTRRAGDDSDTDNDDRHQRNRLASNFGGRLGGGAGPSSAPSNEATVSRAFPASSSRKRPLRGPVSLPLLDWQRRQMWTPGKRPRREHDRDVHASLPLPEQFRKSGIGYRLPPWESVNPASNISDQANHAEPPRTRHSDDIYALWCHKLINCLNGGLRGWATKEFFYSDLDRPFYTANTFATEVAKLGVLPNAKLTRREWSVVRRMIRRRPRRFSKRFILSQLRERNRYRKMARELQQNPDETNHTGYAIPAPIRVGATVTAFNKKFLILNRGIVLHHEPANATYLIQFERKELGYEFCSDTEVASHGVPDILMPAARNRLSGSPHENALSKFADNGSLPYGTSFGPMSMAKTKETITCEMELTNLLSGDQAQSSSKADAKDATGEEAQRAALVEKVAERETLVSLMSIIDAATARKQKLLDAMEKFSTLLVDRLPFGEGAPSNHVISGYFERHFAWLRANLEMTNTTLERASGFLKVMYGKAYSSRCSTTTTRKEQIKKKFVETMLTQEHRLCGGPPSATLHWVAALHHGSNDVGNYLSSLVLQGKSSGSKDEAGSANESEEKVPEENFLRSRVAAAGSILSVIGYCCGRAGESDIALPDGDPPLVDVVMASSAAQLPPPDVSPADMDVVLQDALAERAAAEQELKDAFALLGKEFSGHAFANRGSKRAV